MSRTPRSWLPRRTPLGLLASLSLAAAGLAQAIHDPLIGTVTDPDGKPIAGAKVEVLRAGGSGTGLLDLDYKNDWRRVATTPTDASGRFALQLPVGLPCRLVVDHAPYAVFLRDDCVPGLDMPVRLAMPAVVTGRVTLAGWTPVTAKLRAWHRDLHDEVFRGRTDETGRYHFARVAPGPIRIEIEPDAARAPEWHSVDLEPGQTYTHDVALDAGTLLTGRVTDVVTGRPIAGARIGEGWTLFKAVTSDADGRYELRGYGCSGRRELLCVADGYVKHQQLRPESLPATLAIDFALHRGSSTRGRVVDAEGRPVVDVYVEVFGFERGKAGTGLHDCIGLRTDADGLFATSGLQANVDHVLVVKQDGYAMVVYALPEPDEDGIKPVGDIVLPRPRIVRGVVTDPDGKPRPDTRISIWGYNDDRHRLAPNGNLANSEVAHPHYGKWGILDMYVGRRSGRTDHLGRFAFGDIPAGEFHVTVYGERNARIGKSEPFRVATGEEPALVRIVTDANSDGPVPQVRTEAK